MRRTASKLSGQVRRWSGRIALAVLLLVAGPFVAFVGRLHWLCDLASQFRIQYFWGLALVSAALALLGQWIWAGIAVGMLTGHAAAILPLYVPRAPYAPSRKAADRIRLLSLNVRRSNEGYARIVDFVRATQPEVALFLEVDDAWERALSQLGDRFSHSQVQPRFDSRGIALFSRLPLDDVQLLPLTDDVPVVRAQLTIGSIKLHLFGIHPYPPVSSQMAVYRDRQILEISRAVASVGGQKVVIGDFNMTSWTPAFTRFMEMTGLRDTRRGRGVQSTWPASLPAILRVPIDHCLVSAGIEVVDRKVGPNVGSDHLPVIVDLTFQ